MSEYKDMQKELMDMLEIINTTIEINTKEEQFYRRCSTTASTNEVSKALFLEIADEVEQYLNGMRERRQNLWHALTDLDAAQKKEDAEKEAR